MRIHRSSWKNVLVPKLDESSRVRKISLNPRDIQDLYENEHTGVDTFLTHEGRQVHIIIGKWVPPGEILIEKG